MKKYLLIASACVIVLACEKKEIQNDGISLTASLEQPVDSETKATLNDSRETIWETGDAIRVYIENGIGDWHTNEVFNLTSGNGGTTGTFTCNTSYSSSDKWNVGAYYPYFEASENNGSNINAGNMYFYLPSEYSSYTSGKSYMPLIANMSGGSNQPTSISFKHAGAAVVATITGIPSAAVSIELTVDGKNIHGWLGGFSVANAGTGGITASPGSNSTVKLSFGEGSSANRTFKFIFPLPIISSNMNLTFSMKDKNGITIWKKTATNQSALPRATVLKMPEKAVTAIPQNMYLVGSFNGGDDFTGYLFDNKTGKVNMTMSGNNYVCLRAADTGNWYMTDSYVGSGNTATVKCQSGDKLYVPGGNYVFSISYQDDGSIILSYEDAN